MRVTDGQNYDFQVRISIAASCIKNLHHLFAKILFSNRWRKKI